MADFKIDGDGGFVDMVGIVIPLFLNIDIFLFLDCLVKVWWSGEGSTSCVLCAVILGSVTRSQ